MSDKENSAPVEHLFVVRRGTELYAGWPRKKQAEVYASGFSDDKGMKIEMMLLQPLAARPAAAQEAVAWRWRPKGSTNWIYDPKLDWLEQQGDAVDKESLYLHAPTAAVEQKLDDWIMVETALPKHGQLIEGRNSKGGTWKETWDTSEPVSKMKHWRPANPPPAPAGKTAELVGRLRSEKCNFPETHTNLARTVALMHEAANELARLSAASGEGK